MVNNYPRNFYFSLSFKGEDAAFQEVSGISKEMTFEEVVSGGENRFKYRLPTIVTSQNLVLKRALVPSGSQLLSWCAACVDQGFVKPLLPHDISVNLLDTTGLVCAKWTFYKAYPVKYSISELKSQDNSIVIENIELAYNYFEITTDLNFTSLF